MRAGRFASIAMILGAVIARPARAGECRKASAEAQRLFEQGRAMLDAGRVEAACEVLARSQQIEPGVGTLGLLASCHEQQGRIGAARREYLAAADAARACGDARETFARARAEALRSRLGRLVVRASDPDAVIEARQAGHLVPIDPGAEALVDAGTIAIAARAPGKIDYAATVDVKAGGLSEIQIPPLAPASPAAAPAETPSPPPLAPRAPSSGRRAAIVATGAVGGAGLAVGLGAGLFAMLKKSASDDHCDAQNRCDPVGGALRDEGKRAALASTIGFGVGIAGVGASVILILTQRKSAPARDASIRLAPAVGPGGGGAVLRGGF